MIFRRSIYTEFSKVHKKAAGAESMMLTRVQEHPSPERATLRGQSVITPSHPSRFTFPPTTAASDDGDYIASIVAKAMAICEANKTTKPAEPVASLPTLSAFLESVVLPTVHRKTERDARTLAARRLSERVGFCGPCKISWRLDQTLNDECPRCRAPRILNPGIEQVDSAALGCLASSLSDDACGSQPSPATAGKHLRYLMTILNAATDRGLIRKVKKPRVQQVETIIRVLSDFELCQLYKACESADWPNHSQFTPAAFWRAVIVFCVAFGLRIGELFSLLFAEVLPDKSRKLANGFHAGEECPRRELRHLELKSPRGWWVYLPPKQSGSKPCQLILPNVDTVADHIDAIKGDRRFVFDVYAGLKTNKAGDYRNVKVSIYRQWYRLCEIAGIEADLRATPHDLRRTQETRYDLQFGKGTGGEINGHAARSVSDTYYSQAVPRIHRAVFAYSFPPFEVMR